MKGFQKTKILKPGETQHISLKVKGLQLKFWNEQKLEYVVYNGSYQFQLGKSSENIVDSATVNIRGKIMPKVFHVTVEPENLIFNVGDELDLTEKNKWIKSDIDRSEPHLVADHIVEAVYNNGTFLDPPDPRFAYKSSNNAVAQVSHDGIVRFVGSGVATITVTIDGVSGSTVFVVKQQGK